jgi:hypothetical protein
MQRFIKIDNKFINLDNVTEIHSYDLDGWNVIIYYASVMCSDDGSLQQDFEHFTGEEAAALRCWLEQNATDVIAWYRNQMIDTERVLYIREPERTLHVCEG